MPSAPKRPCPERGCPELTNGGRCEKHRQERKSKRWRDDGRTQTEQGYGADWQRVSRLYRKQYPMCGVCHDEPARSVHHRISIDERPDLRLSWSNLLAVCSEECHRRAERQRAHSAIGARHEIGEA